MLVLSISNLYASAITVHSDDLFDEARQRKIPIITYAKAGSAKSPLVVISHGYTVRNDEYSAIAQTLAEHGYYVVSIQHDMPGDPVSNKDLPIYERRLPLWKRGIENILFVVNDLKAKGANIDFDNLILVGHSQGGDISMLMAKEYPDLVEKVISLDSLRVPFPLRSGILSFRANDMVADPEVIPSLENQKKYSMQIVAIADAKHIDMCDRGHEVLKNRINAVILHFLRDPS